MEHIDMKISLDSKLQIYSICSISIRDIFNITFSSRHLVSILICPSVFATLNLTLGTVSSHIFKIVGNSNASISFVSNALHSSLIQNNIVMRFK